MAGRGERKAGRKGRGGSGRGLKGTEDKSDGNFRTIEGRLSELA